MASCYFCGSGGLQQIFHIKDCPLAGRFLNDASEDELLPLTILLCKNCGIAQVAQFVPKEKLFTNYFYNTHAIRTLVDFFHKEAEQISAGAEKKLSVLEIGGNSCPLGERLAQLGHRCVNVDPSDVAKRLVPKGVELVNDFFNEGVADLLKATYGTFDVIYTANNFAHMEDVKKIVPLMRGLLADGGRLIIQVQDFDYLIDELCFPFFYHEHLFYYTADSLGYFLGKNGFARADVARNPIHGRSIRCTFVRSDEAAKRPDFSGLFERISGFTRRIEENEQAMKKLLAGMKGKKIVAYGASAQANIYFARFGITARDIPYIIDDSPLKQGTLTPFSHLQVKGGSFLREYRPDCVLVTAYNFFTEIRARNPWFRGTWILPLPDVQVVNG